MMRLPLESLNFIDLQELQQLAPRVAERFWERAKREGTNEFISGHLGANITFPVGYMKQLWNIARYLGVRDSFIDEWNPKGGIEIALIDMMTQSYFQWQGSRRTLPLPSTLVTELRSHRRRQGEERG